MVSINVLLSIKPKYVEQILNGNKKYEFRRTVFKKKKGVKAFIYCTSPVKKIVAYFTVNRIFEDTPENLWNNFHKNSGVKFENFFKYFNNKEKGFAIKIENLKKFEKPIDPKELDPSFRPPQSFYYLKTSLIASIEKQGI